MEEIILAISSQHKIKAFKFLGLEFSVDKSDIQEYFERRPENPSELVKMLSRMKCETVAEKYNQGLVIGFDSVGYFNGKILEKPESKREAFKRLKKHSGNCHSFFTGIHIINLNNKKALNDIVVSKVFMRRFEEIEIKKYLDQSEDFKTHALAYNPSDYYSSSFVSRIEGCYNNICYGLPLGRVVEMMKDADYRFD